MIILAFLILFVVILVFSECLKYGISNEDRRNAYNISMMKEDHRIMMDQQKKYGEK